jgi:signal transduction histidine kinase
MEMYILICVLVIVLTIVLSRYLSVSKSNKHYQKLYKTLAQTQHNQIDKNIEQQQVIAYQNRLAQKGQIFNIVAHQWRQPLNTMSILLERLSKAHQNSKLDEKLFDEIYNQISTTLQHMSTTIDDFSDFFKPDREKREFVLSDTINKTIYLLKPMLKKDGIELVEDIDESITYIGYPNELSQAIINIINNAKEAFANQNINKKEISIRLSKSDNIIKIVICDNAGGIDEEILSKIFEPYFSTKGQKNGIGLGLYISKLVIQEHMGGMLYAKNCNDGARFNIEF